MWLRVRNQCGHFKSVLCKRSDWLRVRYCYQAYGIQTNIKITTKEDFDMFDGYDMMKKMKADNEVD